MRAAFQVLTDKYGKAFAERLTCRNQAEILEAMRQGAQ